MDKVVPKKIPYSKKIYFFSSLILPKLISNPTSYLQFLPIKTFQNLIQSNFILGINFWAVEEGTNRESPLPLGISSDLGNRSAFFFWLFRLSSVLELVYELFRLQKSASDRLSIHFIRKLA